MKQEQLSPRRVAGVIGLHDDHEQEYRRLHAEVWPDVLAMIAACGMRNYSIHLRRLDDGKLYLFSYYEYVGEDLEADLARMAADPTTQRWWELTGPCQRPLAARGDGEWWAGMEEVFYFAGPPAGAGNEA